MVNPLTSRLLQQRSACANILGTTDRLSKNGFDAVEDNIMRDICEFLGGRADKDFLGTGNLGLVIQKTGARLLYVQSWKEDGLCDWFSGTVRSWAPDRVEMNEPIPPVGAQFSHLPAARCVFAARDDILGMTLEWKNETTREMTVQASFSGKLPGEIRMGNALEAGYLYALAPYSDRVRQPVNHALASSMAPDQIDLHGDRYQVTFMLAIEPQRSKQLTLFLGIGIGQSVLEESLSRWRGTAELLESVRQDWNSWFDREIPRFQSSNPYFDKLYYYRWWSLYTKMIFAGVGHFLYPAPREGTVGFEGCISYSGACISVDELRWMRDPAWAFSTTREFFTPENLNDGYLSNHIWDWGIDGDENNQDFLGRSVPYQNYAVAAFHDAMLVHPHEGFTTLQAIWPMLCSNLESYPRLFDIDLDGLYETYPWSNSAGQEWTARYLYFDPIPEIFRCEISRTYSPDGSRTAEDLELVRKIRNTVVTDPSLYWPETADELYRIYNGTRDHRLATVDQSTYAYRNFTAASSLARLMDDAAAEKRYANMAEHTRAQICAVMWNPQDAFFYDVRPIIYKHARTKSVTGFFVFWARIAEQGHLQMLHHLFNPLTFWTEFPLPSLPLDYEKYAELQKTNWTYWNYCTWPRTTCHVVDGLLWAAKGLDSTLAGNAAQLFDRYTRMHFLNGDVRIPNIAERYDPHTAEPILANLDYNHSSWIDLVIQHVAGITPQAADEIVIDPVDMGWESFSLTNVRYRNHDIDVEYTRTQGLVVRVDGVEKVKSPRLQKIVIHP
jgi:hypothetical protein